MSAKVSAGLLMYRRSRDGALELLVAHPGGPYFRRKHEHAWTIPKGVVDDGEGLLEAAQREFEEETGFSPHGPFVSLGEIRQRSGKRVHAWAFEGDCDPAALASNDFEVEWPPRSGKKVLFPEIDELRFVPPDEARRLLNKSQSELVDRLLSALGEA